MYIGLKFYEEEQAQRRYDSWLAKGFANLKMYEVVGKGWVVECDLPN